ncbi:MAG: hypothetical protein GX621_08095 [Pirellulaceae bacterium]|nr:hypothetical protein [Pirellulaceae bacterium]
MNRVVPRGKYGYLAVVAVVFAAGAAGMWWTVRHTDRQMRDELLAQTQLVAQALSVDDVKELTGTDADLASSSYERLKRQLARVEQAREDPRPFPVR